MVLSVGVRRGGAEVQKKTSVKGVQVGGARRSREGERESEVEGAAGKFLDRIISVPLFSLSLSSPPCPPPSTHSNSLSNLPSS